MPTAFEAHGNATTRVRSESCAREVVEVERRVVADVGEADDEVEVVRELEPGRDVAVVVEPRDDDLVAGLELAPERAREREVERRHVRAEDDLLRRAAEERRRPRRDSSTSASVRRLVSYGPLTFAFDSRR